MDNFSIGMTVREALSERHSVRRYADTPLPEETVMDLLWAANGISRENGRRTAPSAINAQDILLYVCRADGVYRYDPVAASLEPVTRTDIRPMMEAHNHFIYTVPLTILLVSDQTRFEPRPNNRNRDFAFMDAGMVSENISLYCTSLGLGTVCCAPPMDLDAIRAALGLTGQQIPVLYHPIGYPAE